MNKQTSPIQRLICAVAILGLLSGCELLGFAAIALGARPGGGGGYMCARGDYRRDDSELEREPIYKAIKNNNPEQVSKHLNTPKKINKTQTHCSYKHTYLHYAIYVHAYDVALYLIEHGAEVKNLPQETYPLLYAFQAPMNVRSDGHYKWLERNDNLDEQFQARLRLLHKLIESGVDVNAFDDPSNFDHSPLYYFLWNGFAKEAQILIDSGASLTPNIHAKETNSAYKKGDIQYKQDINRTLEIAFKGSQLNDNKGNPENVLIMDKLIEKGADPCRITSIPHYLFWQKGRHREQDKYLEKYYWNTGETGKDILNTQKKFIQIYFGEKCNNKPHYQGTYFRDEQKKIIMLYTQRPDLLPLLLSRFGPIDILFANETSKPMLAAIEALNVDSMRILRTAGATIPTTNKDGENSIYIAAQIFEKGSMTAPSTLEERKTPFRQVIEQLIDWGENPELADNYGRRAIDSNIVKEVVALKNLSVRDEKTLPH